MSFISLEDTQWLALAIESNDYGRDCEISIHWEDLEIGVRRPLREPLVSARDSASPTLREIRDRLPRQDSPSG